MEGAFFNFMVVWHLVAAAVCVLVGSFMMFMLPEVMVISAKFRKQLEDNGARRVLQSAGRTIDITAPALQLVSVFLLFSAVVFVLETLLAVVGLGGVNPWGFSHWFMLLGFGLLILLCVGLYAWKMYSLGIQYSLKRTKDEEAAGSAAN